MIYINRICSAALAGAIALTMTGCFSNHRARKSVFTPPVQGLARESSEPVKANSPITDPLGMSLFRHEAGISWDLTALVDGQQYHLTRLPVNVTPPIDTIKNGATAGQKSALQPQSGFSYLWMRDGKIVQAETYRVDDKAIYCVSTGEKSFCRFIPPIEVLPLPLKGGETWSWKGKFVSPAGEIPAIAECKVSGPIGLKTSSAVFTTVYEVEKKFTLQEKQGSKSLINTQWYKPGVGLVREVQDDGQRVTTTDITQFHSLKTMAPSVSKGVKPVQNHRP